MTDFYDSFKICAESLSESLEFLEIDPDQKAEDHGCRHGPQAEAGHVPGNTDGPHRKGQGAGSVINGHGQPELATGIQGHHSCDRRMKKGRPRRADDNAKQ
mgnify:CR=1 FL=1